MGSAEHRKFGALLQRYLDPAAEWAMDDDLSMRTAMRESEECARAYDRAVSMHRLMVGADPMLPSGHERRRMMLAVLDAVESVEASQSSIWERFASWLKPLALASAAVAALLVVGQTDTVERVVPTEDVYIGSRGITFDLTVGIGVSGVTEDSTEYEAVAGDTALHIDEYMRIYTTREVDLFPNVFVFGLQDGFPLWYAPDPEHGEDGSIAAERGRSIPLGGRADPFEIKLSGRHKVGSLQVVALFTDEPVSVTLVAEALSSRPDFVPVETWLEASLKLTSTGRIRILDLEVEPGMRRQPDE